MVDAWKITLNWPQYFPPQNSSPLNSSQKQDSPDRLRKFVYIVRSNKRNGICLDLPAVISCFLFVLRKKAARRINTFLVVVIAKEERRRTIEDEETKKRSGANLFRHRSIVRITIYLPLDGWS